MARESQVVCIYCGRRGSRQFMPAGSRTHDREYVDQWYCANRKACEKRQKERPLPDLDRRLLSGQSGSAE